MLASLALGANKINKNIKNFKALKDNVSFSFQRALATAEDETLAEVDLHFRTYKIWTSLKEVLTEDLHSEIGLVQCWSSFAWHW